MRRPAEEDDGGCEDEDEDETFLTTKKTTNVFALLNEEEEEEIVDDEDEVDLGEGIEGGGGEPEEEASVEPVVPTVPKSKTKKKKKKKKSKRSDTVKNEEIGIELMDGELRGWEGRDNTFWEEVDAMMKEIERMVLETSMEMPRESAPKNDDAASEWILQVDVKKLRSDWELRRMFGSEVVDERRRSSAAESRRLRGGAALRSRKKSVLIVPRDQWVADARGLTMAFDRDERDASYFRYRFAPSYREVQEEYYRCVESYDPNALVHLLSRHPYHVDSLIQLAEVYRQARELERAAELIERSLFLLERAWPHNFKPFDGSCRVDYDIPENRSLFIALFQYQLLLSRRGLHRTALEVCKLLLNLDPKTDPMGALLCLDSFALQVRDPELVLDLSSKFRNIQVQHIVGFAFSRVLADQGSLGTVKTRAALSHALIRFPMALKPILAACKQRNEGQLISRAPFVDWEYDVDDGGRLERLSKVYAVRSIAIWSKPENMALLRAAAEDAIAIYVKGPSSTETIADQISKRNQASTYLTETRLYEQLYISDFCDSTASLPAAFLDTEPVGGGIEAGRVLQADHLTTGGALRQFFASLLPWNTVEDLVAGVDASGGDTSALWEAINDAIEQAQLAAQDADLNNEDPNPDEHEDS